MDVCISVEGMIQENIKFNIALLTTRKVHVRIHTCTVYTGVLRSTQNR